MCHRATWWACKLRVCVNVKVCSVLNFTRVHEWTKWRYHKIYFYNLCKLSLTRVKGKACNPYFAMLLQKVVFNSLCLNRAVFNWRHKVSQKQRNSSRQSQRTQIIQSTNQLEVITWRQARENMCERVTSGLWLLLIGWKSGGSFFKPIM